MNDEYKTLYVKIAGIDKPVLIREDVYPLAEMNVVYIRMVQLSDDGTPETFILARPEDIEYRVQEYTEEFMQEILDASDAAIKQQAEYMAKQMKQAADAAANTEPTAPSEHDFI